MSAAITYHVAIIQRKGGFVMIVNGYAYPFINSNVLSEWLPSLTYLSSFSYGFTPVGDIIDLNDGPLLSAAAASGTKTLMVLTPFDINGKFNSSLVTSLFAEDAVTDRLIDNILITVREKGFSGVDFDFEYIFSQDRDRYTALVRKTREILNGEGLIVTATLAPKTSADQAGLLYEGHDYRGMGQAANYVLLMTYEWGYTLAPQCYMQ